MTVNGSQIADAVYLIKNGAASCSCVQIENAAVSETVLWENTLAADHWLRFTSLTQRVELSEDDGATWNVSNIGVTGRIPQLQGGINNVIALTGPTTGTRNITYTSVG